MMGLYTLARTQRVFFDKTGTLSESDLRVTELWVDETADIVADCWPRF